MDGLGFADSFLHGRLGSLVLKRLIDHAYSFTNTVDDELAQLLEFMLERLKKASPKKVDASTVKEWSVFTDTSYNMEGKVSGLGGVPCRLQRTLLFQKFVRSLAPAARTP